jgi:catechol 2,3-dioxygenase-like lactoylglutathione lyase family enzyme
MMNNATPPAGELFVTQFLVVSDQDRSRDFYQSVFGADVVRDRDPVILALANTRIVLNVGGGPTDDKPTVRLAPPADPRRLAPCYCGLCPRRPNRPARAGNSAGLGADR